MNIYLGIDPSYTRTGIVIIDEAGKAVYQDCIASALTEKGLEAIRAGEFLMTAMNALQYIGNQFPKATIHICLEYPIVRIQKAPAAVKVHEAFAVMACAIKIVFGVNIRSCYPTQWKVTIGAKHNRNMKVVSQYITDKYSIEFDNFDLYAAYGIAMHLRRQIQIERAN